MARKNFGHYQEFMNAVVDFWQHFGADFSFGEWDRAEVEKEQAGFKALNERIQSVEFDLGLLRSQRDAKCKRYENLSSRLRGAVLGTFGAASDQLAWVPRLMKVTAGRPNKAAETRKKNTIQRKAAALEAAEAEKIAALRANL